MGDISHLEIINNEGLLIDIIHSPQKHGIKVYVSVRYPYR